MIVTEQNSYWRLTSRGFTQLSDWNNVVRRSYPVRGQTLELPHVERPGKAEARKKSESEAPVFKDHKEVAVVSVIDVHAWDQAKWRGCGYLQFGDGSPPTIALLFENEVAARKIFERWRARFGSVDVNEQIAVSIIRHLPQSNPHHYCVQFASNPEVESEQSARPMFMATRSMTMEPGDSVNLENFLNSFRQFKAYTLVPGVLASPPRFLFDLGILKKNLTVKSASEVREHDIESLALQIRGYKTA